MPPPSTPAQPRFLLSKRQAPQSQSQTQKQTTAPRQAGPQQFASTPRFNVSNTAASSGATVSNNPPVFSTPAPPPSARQWSTQRTTCHDPVDDAIDSSPISFELREAEHSLIGCQSPNEDIEIDSSPIMESSLEQNDRPTKRRRVSLSPEIGASSDDDEDDGDHMELDHEESAKEALSISASIEARDDVVKAQSESSSAEVDSEDDGLESFTPTEPSTRHPTFHKAPRFKATQVAEVSQQSDLPNVFSPQRRGARYVPGGLAAEMRNWLVQVKDASKYDRSANSSVEAVVDELKGSIGMYLVAAHEKDNTARQHEGKLPRFILAGDGNIAGLNGRNIVRQGTTLSLHQPMWNVSLNDLGHFTVACNWEIPNGEP